MMKVEEGWGEGWCVVVVPYCIILSLFSFFLFFFLIQEVVK